jgi:hypothetical protein
MALPRLRPFDSLPASFGREWTPVPPRFSLRSELQAFYAAFSRTFCLSAAAIRSMCQWEQPRTELGVPNHADVDVPAVPAAPAENARKAASEWVARSPVRARVARQHLLAGGAIATGSVALLAWTMLKTVPDRPMQTIASVDATVPLAVPPSPRSMPPELSTPVKANSDTPSRSGEGGTASTPAKSVGKPGSRHIGGVTVRPGNVVRGRQIVAPAETKGRRATNAAAGHFSPSATKWAVEDDYASVKTWARLLPSESRPSSPGTVRADDTGWMDKMQQRRITELPEKFAQ